MTIELNSAQTKNLASFLNSMAVIWFAGAFVNSNSKFDYVNLINFFRYIIFGIASITFSSAILKEVKD